MPGAGVQTLLEGNLFKHTLILEAAEPFIEMITKVHFFDQHSSRPEQSDKVLELQTGNRSSNSFNSCTLAIVFVQIAYTMISVLNRPSMLPVELTLK